MAELEDIILRIAVDFTHRTPILSQTTEATPEIWSGTDLTLDLGVFSANDPVALSNVASVKAQVKTFANGQPSSDDVAVLFESEVLVADMTTTITSSAWDAKTAQHARFTFTAADTSRAAGNYWIFFTATLTDASTIPLGGGVIRILADGVGELTATDDTSVNILLESDLATQAEAEAGTDSTAVMTALRVAQAIAALDDESSTWGAITGTLADQTDLQSALDLKADASDVSNVDNTSDVNKPISTAQQTALDDKSDSSHSHLTSDITDAGTFGKQLLQQDTKRFAQDSLSVPLPYAAFVHTLDQDEWRKAIKFTATDVSAISPVVSSTTGYARILNPDGTWESVDGIGSVDISFSMLSKTISGTSFGSYFYAIIPCDVSGNISGDLTYFSNNGVQLTSFDATGLSSLEQLVIIDGQLTSFDGAGLTSLTSLNLNSNQLTSFDGAGLTSLTYLNLNSNQLTSFDSTGLTSLTSLNLTDNQLTSFVAGESNSLLSLNLSDTQLTSFDGAELTSLISLNLSDTQLTSFDATGLSSLTSLTLSNTPLISIDLTGLNMLTDFTVTYNSLTSIRAVGVGAVLYHYSSYGVIDISNNLLDGAALDQFYTDLDAPDEAGSGLNVSGNIGTSSDTPTIATAKGYTVIGT